MNGSSIAFARRPALLAACIACHCLAGAALAERTRGPIDEAVLVTGRAPAASAVDAASTAGAITLLDAEALRGRSVAHLADMLRYVPGVWSASESGADDVFISSRGSNLDATDYDMNGVKLLQDGLPVTTADGNNHNRVLDPLAAAEATIARGANALQYGASTLGGAVNFVSPTARDGAASEVLVNAGSHGQRLARATFGGVASERLDGLVTLETKRWDGYRAHGEQRRAGLYANAGWQPSDALATRFFVTYLDNDQRLPGALTRAELGADPSRANSSALGGDYQLDVTTLRLANKTELALAGGGTLSLGASYETQALFHPIVDKVMVDFDGAGPEPPVEVFSLLIDTDHRNVAAIARYRRELGAHDLLLGFGYAEASVDGEHFRNDGGRPNGATALIDNDARSIELYAVDRWRIGDRWLVELAAQGVAARRDVRTTDAATGAVRNPAGDYSRLNPRVGTIFDLAGGAALYANVSRLYEPPTTFELEDEASGAGTLLDAMRGTVLEAGVRGGGELGRGGRWSWDVALYRARIDGEILSVEDPNAPGTSLSANVERTVHAGVEAVVAAEIPVGRRGGVLAPIASATWNRFVFDGDPIYGDNDLPAAPGRVVRAELIYRHPSGFYAGPTLDAVGARFADFANTYRVPSYTLVGFRAGWANERWRVFADTRNLRDERYVATLAVRERAGADAAILYPGEPRSVYVGVDRRL